jgi:hypothetical protein
MLCNVTMTPELFIAPRATYSLIDWTLTSPPPAMLEVDHILQQKSPRLIGRFVAALDLKCPMRCDKKVRLRLPLEHILGIFTHVMMAVS